MQLQRFFDQSIIDLCTKHPVITIGVADDAPTPILLSGLLMQRWQQEGIMLTPLSMLQSESTVRAQLETSFLGQKHYLWLTQYDQLPAKQRKAWAAYLQAYTGPHTIIYTTAHAKDSAGTDNAHIALPARVDKRLYTALVRYCLQEKLQPLQLRRIDELFTRTDQLPLEQACLLFYYQRLVGRNSKQFCDQWLDKLVVPRSSLFSLSQYLFEQKSTPFMRAWHRISDKYPPQFWLVYWSEQFWRATWYCQFMQEKKIAQAKKMGFRLPYSFLQKWYRHYQPAQLSKPLQELYALDYALKNGGNPLGLDLVLYRFLLSGS